MVYFISALFVVALCVGAYLFAIAPSRRKAVYFPYNTPYIAHRGLFDNRGQAPENSMAAFRHAVECGYGIELDIQKTKDDKLVVFHDETLERMCGVGRVLSECTFEEIANLHLAESEETIPLFADFLAMVDGAVPLIVEIKPDGEWAKTTQMVLELLKNYNGAYCIESFNPRVIGIVRREAPYVTRGQLSSNYFKDEPQMGWCKKFVLTNLMMNFISRPDFVAYDHHCHNQFSYRVLKRVFGCINVCWTIKSQAELEEAKRHFDSFIFDSFIPDRR